MVAMEQTGTISPGTSTPNGLGKRGIQTPQGSPPPIPKMMSSMLENLASSLPSSAVIEGLRAHRRDLSRMVQPSTSTFNETDYALGPIPIPSKDDADKEGFYVVGDPLSASQRLSDLFVEAFLREIRVYPIANVFPVNCSVGAQHGFAFSVHLPAAVSSSALGEPGKAPARPIVSTTSDVSLATYVETLEQDSAAFLDALVSMRWSTPQLQAPLVCRYKFSRAIVYSSQFVVCISQPGVAKVGRPFTLLLSLLNRSKTPKPVSIIFQRPVLIEEGLDLFSDHANKESLAGLECIDRRVSVGQCDPDTTHSVSIPFIAYRTGVYDLSSAVLIDESGATAIHAKFIGAMVHVSE
jgi:hypothetical protein